jgi:small subunit ribosomal protein S12
MVTIRQLVRNNRKTGKVRRSLVPGLRGCPQRKGVVQRIYQESPKKPNSAKRKVAKVKLTTGRVVQCYIPGEGHSLNKYSVILVRGGRAQDLIGVRYKPIFGLFDCKTPPRKTTRRSKYGIKNPNKQSLK